MPDNLENTTTEKKIVPITSERPTYMIAPRRGPSARLAGVQPMSASTFNQTLIALGLDIVGHIKRGSGTIATLSAGTGEATDITLAKIEPERAELLQRTLPANLMIAKDVPLTYGGEVKTKPSFPSISTFSLTAETKTFNVKFQILGKNDKPLPKVTVQLAGEAFPAQGLTNENGEVELEFITIANRPPRFLMVTAPDSYWDLYLPNPQISDNTVNIIQMRSFSDTITGFPEQFHFGWGQRLMGLDKLPKEINGAGVKIAIIDSGCDNTHPLLSHIQKGKDFTGDPNPDSWRQDVIGHGTHCAGVIAARSKDGSMMRGFAPEAEIHILRVFPGGQYSSLVEALDYCINNQIDIVNMSLGGDSEINSVVEETLEIAVLNGIACIVAAGNSGDAVKYPARSPQAFAVAAVGNLKNLQSNTWDAMTVQEGLVAEDGIFSPSFTCFGPEIAVCAPGVEIISTVPGGTFEAMSGTSMAAPHVTGLAALLLAHHSLFRTQFQNRGPQRVAALFNLMRSLCTPYGFGSTKTGAGFPKLDQIVSAVTGAISQPTVPAANGGIAPVASGGIVPAANSGVTSVASSGMVPAANSGVTPMSLGGFVPTASGVTPMANTGWPSPLMNKPQFALQGWVNNSVANFAPNQLNSTMPGFMCPIQDNPQFYIRY